MLLVSSVAFFAQSGSDLTWPQHATLTWDDFKGQAPKSEGPPSALSDTGFKYQLLCTNGMLDIDAQAFFSPSGSWVKPNDKNPELLKHEQGHFNMAELYALRLGKAIRDARVNCENTTQANAAGEKIVSEFQHRWQDAERRYEEDTKEGTDVAKQTAASNRIDAELAALKADKQ